MIEVTEEMLAAFLAAWDHENRVINDSAGEYVEVGARDRAGLAAVLAIVERDLLAPRAEHLRRMYATGTTQIGGKNVTLIACSACSNADLRAEGLSLAAVIRAAEHHIAETECFDRRHAGMGLPCEVCPGPCEIDGEVAS